MAMNQDEVIGKIRKLLELSGSKNEYEAALAAAKASKLLQEYNLDMATIELSATRGSDAITSQRVSEFKKTSQQARFSKQERSGRINVRQAWIVDLADMVARVHFCKALFAIHSIQFVGRTREVGLAQEMFESLFNQLTVLSATKSAEYSVWYRDNHGTEARYARGEDNVRTWRRSWLEGASDTVTSKLGEQLREFESHQSKQSSPSPASKPSMTGMELMVIRGNEVQAYLDKRRGLTKSGKPKKQRFFNAGGPSRINWNGYDQGRMDGHRVTANKKLPGSS